MAINENTIKGSWLEFKGEVQKQWGRLKGDELEKTKGDIKAIGGLIQQNYGEAQENSNDRLHELLQHLEDNKDKSIQILKNKIK